MPAILPMKSELVPLQWANEKAGVGGIEDLLNRSRRIGQGGQFG